MKKAILLPLLMTFLCVLTFGQSGEIKKSNGQCSSHFMNRSISFCNLQSDTLSYDQISNCSESLLRVDPTQQISYYTLIIIYPGDAEGFDLHEYQGTGNQIPDEIKSEIISKRAEKIFFENLYVNNNGQEKLDGYRAYYFR